MPTPTDIAARADLDTLATTAFGQARICRSVIRDEILPRLKPHDRRLAERVVRRIDRHEILLEAAVGEIEALADQVAGEVRRGTVQYLNWPSDPATSPRARGSRRISPRRRRRCDGPGTRSTACSRIAMPSTTSSARQRR